MLADDNGRREFRRKGGDCGRQRRLVPRNDHITYHTCLCAPPPPSHALYGAESVNNDQRDDGRISDIIVVIGIYIVKDPIDVDDEDIGDDPQSSSRP